MEVKNSPNERARRVAVIGMACRLPGAANYDEFWGNLHNERCSVGEIPPERWSKDQFYSPQSEDPNKSVSKWGGFIDGIDQFDATFFGISPREAQCMDPQQRIMLELAWSCFEDAGYSQSKISGSRTAVFIGTGNLDHSLVLQESRQPVSAHWGTGVHLSVIPNRISYAFNLNGPSASIDSACSGSLLSLHQGVQSLRSGESTMALIGGCSILTNATHFTSFSKMGMLSPDGVCRTFDEKANGYVRGEGAAFVLLKLEEQALADGDRILGIICGSAVNHGGRARTLTSPNAFAQARVIVDAHLQANISPDSVSYIEAQGTATPKGDPIEITGLKRAFAKLSDHSGVTLNDKTCAIGSVKTNIGHLEPVSGMAGLIKILLCMQHKMLPKLLHFEKLNSRINLEGTPFYMLDKSEQWLPGKAGDGTVYPRRAGISAFGFGGTNVHIVLEEASQPASRQDSKLTSHLIFLSAKTEEALQQRQRQLVAWLTKKDRNVELLDLSSTLLLGRQHWEFRFAFVAQNVGEVQEKLEQSIRANNVAGCFRGVVEQNKNEVRPSSMENPADAFVEKLRQRQPLDALEYCAGLRILAESYSKGHDVDWAVIFDGTSARRIALPTYPFAKKRYSIFIAPHETALPISNAVTPTADNHPDVTGQRLRIEKNITAPTRAAPIMRAAEMTGQQHRISLPARSNVARPVQIISTLQANLQNAQLSLAQSSGEVPLFVSEQLLQEELRHSLAAALYMDKDAIKPGRPFVELGLDSVVGVEWIRAINKRYGLSMPATKLYDYATIDALVLYVKRALLTQGKQKQNDATKRSPLYSGEKAPSSPDASKTQRGDSAVVRLEPSVSQLSDASNPSSVSSSNYGLELSTVHSLDEVSLTEWVVPAPAHGEVTIRVFASAINFPDVMCIQGLYPTMPEYPFVPGFEVAGVVSMVGDGVPAFQIGDEVIAITGRELGGHASHVNVPLTHVIRKPKNMTFEEACSIPVIFSTVQHAFEVAKLAPREHVLIQTATGGCGLAALQMARLQSCICYGTSSQSEKLEILRRIGVEHAINYKTSEFDSEIHRISEGRGVDVVLNMLSGEAIQRGLNCLAPFGRYLEIAVHALRTSQKLDLSRLVQNQSVHSIDLRRIIMENGTNWAASFNPLLPLFESRQLVPIVSRIYPVGQIVEAMRYVTQGKHIGKVVISHTRTEMIDCTEQCINGMIEQQRNCERFSDSRINFLSRSVPMEQDERPGISPHEGIAVIGMSGQFPQAKNLEEFWQNICQGKDCIDEVPASRWSIADHYDANGKIPGKTSCRWMGAMADVDQFDPLFFNIAPAEARLMDPEQRLFLQNVWHCLEDAGIRPSSIGGTRCGVFVGCAAGDYGQMLGAQRLNAQGLMGGSTSILAGRVSYFLNLQGPCLSIDTACSSSLAAVAEACNSLLLGTSDLAFAGGAYVMSGPSMHIMTGQAGMLSKAGRCQTFDQRADGFVPGEGVGVVLLKRLSDAQRDEDRIYGVIKGWGINQDGKTNGITAPSVNSQIALEKEIYERFAINPEHISLVEAHGTGTKLGDPIEVEALTQSFGAYTDKKQYCALGSVKANIGHLLTSAGIAGLIKVMLCMRHKKFVPSANYALANEHINFLDSPFFVNTEYRDWDLGSNPTRMATVSSFGFSGTNVHVVMEESPVAGFLSTGDTVPQSGSVVIVLSAKSPAQLKTYAQDLHEHLKSHDELRLEDLAYTLQIGREPMDYRVAFTASSYENLLERLDGYVSSPAPMGTLVAQAGAGNKFLSYFMADADAHSLVRTWMHKKDLEKLAELWIQGMDLDWHQLYEESRPLRIGLPGYSFAKERYWVSPSEARKIDIVPARGSAQLHPLLHQNRSTFAQQCFQSRFSGDEFFLADHRVQNKKVLPGAAHLEMAQAAVMQSMDGSGKPTQTIKLQDVLWIRPVILDHEPADICIALEPQENGRIDYQIYRQSPAAGGQMQVYSTGSAILGDVSEPAHLDLTRLHAECSLSVLTAEDCYAAFSDVQLDYGPGHRGLERVHRGIDKAIAKLCLPATLLATMHDYALHPALLDSALQACIGLLADKTGAFSRLMLPYALSELQMLAPCKASMWAYVRFSTGNAGQADKKMDIDLCDESGRVCVRLRGFSLRATVERENLPSIAPIEQARMALARCDWQSSDIVRKSSAPEFKYAGRMVIFCELDGLDKQHLRARFTGAQCLFFDEREASIGLRFQRYAERVLGEIQQLFRQSSAEPLLLQVAYSTQHEHQLLGAISGMLKAAHLETPLFHGQIIGFDAQVSTDGVAECLQEESLTDDQWICYRDNRRYVKIWHALEAVTHTQMPWKIQGVYLITGGAGGLGFIFADEIIRKNPTSRLILTGRSALSPSQRARMKALRPLGGGVEYRQADVTDKPAVIDLVAGIERDYGRLDGIIHSAGVLRDGFIRQKDLTEVASVLAPKVLGVVNLDEASQTIPLDFFVVFSSIASVMGNAGQADYATANAFIDMYAYYRDQLVKDGRRRGKSLSINWPLWKDGGMQVDRDSEELIRRKIGVVGTEEGKQAFYQAMSLPYSQIAVTTAAPEVLNAIRRKDPIRRDSESGTTAVNDKEKVRSIVVEVLVNVLKIPTEKLDVAAPFEKYGIDSIVQTTLIQKMEQVFGELPRTLLFEHTNIEELVEFLAQNYSSRLSTSMPSEKVDAERQSELTQPVALERKKVFSAALPNQELLQPVAFPSVSENTDIAIIGISGRYPQSATLEKLWQNLMSGNNCVTRAPAARWTSSLHTAAYIGLKETSERDYFGGFLDHVDRFDHNLFEVAAENVLGMTPELRMYLETVWETFEDAGYSKSRLQALQEKHGKGVGVFVGSMYSQYGWTMPSLDDAVMNSNETDWQIANRVSHFFDLSGPSIAVNTACSSSMTAIHLACESLRQQGCSMAIAGGVNLTLDRSKYDKLRQVKILDDGFQSKSFGIGDGYVPGEGVGAVLLKPLALAIQDNDRIEGIIKSSFINHSGGRQKYTVPDPKRQSELIVNSIRQAKIDPDTITYVESAANGSPLGDPIEVLALNNAFEKFTKKKQFCALGSVKSNLGHLEAASGISQLSKVLLQLKHKTLVSSIHAVPMNPAIKLGNGAFYLQQETAPWHQLTDSISGAMLPRRCMINSFGAGGGYANLILEEYVAKPDKDVDPFPIQSGGQMCVFSAMTKGSLHRYLEAFYEYIKENSNISIVDVASSLSKINNDLHHRAAVFAISRDDLLTKLSVLLDEHGSTAADVFSSSNVVDAESSLNGSVEGDGNLYQTVIRWITGRRASLDRLDYGVGRPCLSLPKYSFEHEIAFNFSDRTPTLNKAHVLSSNDFYRSIFEKIAQGALSEATAWELVQITEI